MKISIESCYIVENCLPEAMVPLTATDSYCGISQLPHFKTFGVDAMEEWLPFAMRRNLMGPYWA